MTHDEQVHTLGFTGTREGFTIPQGQMVQAVLTRMQPKRVVHGGAAGADTEFHDMTRLMLPNTEVVVRPARAGTWANLADGMVTVHPPRLPLDRNVDIVADSDVLVATPKDMAEERRSGTWATVRHARREGKRIVVVWPDGTVSRERGGVAA